MFTHKFQWIVIIISLFALCTLAACSTAPSSDGEGAQEVTSNSGVHTDTPTEHSVEDDTMDAGTAASGDLHFYTSQPDEDAARLIEAFQAHHPDVNVHVFRSGTEEVISKIQAEKQAGAVQADVLLVADAVTFEILKEQDMLLSYASPELAGIGEEYIDPDHTYAGTKIISTILAVNTTQVDNMPDSWHVLVGDDARGIAMMPGPQYSGAAAYNLGVLIRTEEFGWKYFEQLKENEMVVGRGNGGVLQAVAGGEKSYGMVVDYLVARAVEAGSPVQLIYPQEGVPAITEPVGILKNARNVPAAQAFVDFILSEEGQKLQADLGYTPLRSGLEAPAGLKNIDEIKLITADIGELYQHRDADKEQFLSIFTE